MLFSQRKGIKPSQKAIQIDSMDTELRNSLWNLLDIFYWRKIKHHDYRKIFFESNLSNLFHKYYLHFFKITIDQLTDSFSQEIARMKSYFFKCDWNEVYDLIEFTVLNGPDNLADDFCKTANSVLERESSAYRFVNYQIVEITSAEEIEAIEEAIKTSVPFSGVRSHLSTALRMLSDRKNPDYRNSIKESISAVESLAKIITGNDKKFMGSSLEISVFGSFPLYYFTNSSVYPYSYISRPEPNVFNTRRIY